MEKRLISLLLVAAMLLSFGALAEGTENSAFATPHTLKITWFEQGWTGPEAGKDLVAPAIAEKTNLTLEYEAMTTPTSDDYTQQMNLMVASNEIPDAFFGGIDNYTRVIYTKLGEAGKIWDLTGMVTEEEHPNLYALIHPELNLYQSDKGQNWFLPTQTGRGYENLNEPPHGVHVNIDYLEQLGMEYPQTTEELYTFISRSVNELGAFGLLMGENLDGVTALADMFFPRVGLHDAYGMPFDLDNDYKVCNYAYADCPELQEAAKYIWRLSNEGLLDPEVLVLKDTQYQEKASSGLYAAYTASWWGNNTFNDAIGKVTYVAAPQIYSNEEVKKTREIPWTDWVGCWSSLIISKNVDEDTVRHLLAAMDWMATEEGQLLLNVGIEGETYVWNDNLYEYTESFREATNDLDWNAAAAYGIFYYAQLVQNAPMLTDFQATPSALLREDNMLSWKNREEERSRYDKHMEPTYDYYFLKGEKENELMPAINDVRLEFWAKVLTAGSEEEVEQLVHNWGETCVNMGIDQVVEERQNAISAIIAEMNS